MGKITIAEKLKNTKMKSPNGVYNVLGWVWKTFVAPKYNAHYTVKTPVGEEGGPFIMISNHASRMDYIYTGIPVLPKRMNYVAGYNEFFRSHLALVFGLLRVIPKRNFVPDNYTIREVNRVLKNGGNIMIFPEGMSSISGANQPVAIGTGKLLKLYKLPVYYSVIKGGYLTSPKYNVKDRPGKVEVVVDRLFTPEQLKEMTPEQIEDRINEAIYHDDYAWNKVEQNHYAIGENGAEHLEDLLFWCPRCNRQHTMKGEGNKFYCTACGNGAMLMDTYDMVPFDEDCVIPETQTEWFNQQREVIRQEIADPDFILKEKVKLGNLPKYKYLKNQATSEIVGEGELTLDRSGLTYRGTRDGEAFTFHIPSLSLPTYGMCTDLSRFYTFYNGEFMEFYPENSIVEKFFLATEEIHRLNGGKWKAFKPNDQ
ncbi:MAG: 1-acyl-sn-glycerol-3-phosphate acyltransferase [Lachnospiraceae bacterium]|nr:1-acyl-sn-glycerol-3-phosphate acyltransferase [Lachnospiraceae bacterium]